MPEWWGGLTQKADTILVLYFRIMVEWTQGLFVLGHFVRQRCKSLFRSSVNRYFPNVENLPVYLPNTQSAASSLVIITIYAKSHWKYVAVSQMNWNELNYPGQTCLVQLEQT